MRVTMQKSVSYFPDAITYCCTDLKVAAQHNLIEWSMKQGHYALKGGSTAIVYCPFCRERLEYVRE